MKTKLLLLIILYSCASFSQNSYTPFPEGKADWLIEIQGSPWGLPGGQIYYTNGDTIIGGTTYNKILVSNLGETYVYEYPKNKYQISTAFPFSKGAYSFAYRNDIQNKKVYALYKDSTNERLWFDFNLKIGDTLKNNADANYQLLSFPYNIGTQYNSGTNIHDFELLIVKSVDSISICGKYHKRFNFNSSIFPLSLIEGLGFDSYFLGSKGEVAWFEPSNTYKTYFSSEEQCNQNTFYNILTNSVDFLAPLHHINVYPNPTKNTFAKPWKAHVPCIA